MKHSSLSGAKEWGNYYSTGAGALYPDENLVRIIKGTYATIPRSGRVLDAGFGRGANLVMFAQNGYEAHGLEVSQENLTAAEELAARAEVKLHVGLLTEPKLPYPDAYFDIVLSWSAIYYFGKRSLVAAAIEEFRRVLRPTGVLLMSVVHPNNCIVKRLSNDLGEGTRRIVQEWAYDNRAGLEIFYDETSAGWKSLLAGFSQVEEGYAEAQLFDPNRRLAWRLFLARKNSP